MSMIDETDLYDACKVLFGSNVRVDKKFLQYIEPAGIKSAFRKKALVTHPDRYASYSEDVQKDYAEQFRHLTSAYEKLTKYLKMRDNGEVRFRGATCSAGTTQGYRKDFTTYYKDRQTSSTRSGFARSYSKAGASYQRAYTKGFTSSWKTKTGGDNGTFKSKTQTKGTGAGFTYKENVKPRSSANANNTGEGKSADYTQANKATARPFQQQYTVTPERAATEYKQKLLPNRQLKLGEYLYYTGVVSWKDLISALVWQSKTRQRVGEIANRWGWIEEHDINEYMKIRSKGERIGDLLIRLDVITPFQRNMLVWQQQKSQKPLGEYFIKQGIVNSPVLKRYVKNLKEHNVKYHKDKDVKSK